MLTLVAFLLTSRLPFFWDTIQLGAKQATHIYETGTWLLPDALDSGHPPGFGWYLAQWWHLLGRSLWVSHLAMAPWIWLVYHQLFLLSRDLVGSRWWLLALLVGVEPVLLGQLTLISPDVVLAGAWLLGLRQAFLGPMRKNFYLFFAVVVLALVSTRGWVAALALFLVAWIPLWVRVARNPEVKNKKNRKGTLLFFGLLTGGRLLALFLTGGVLALTYLYYHQLAKGWIGYHPDSPWAASFTRVGFGGMLRNFALVTWRWLDVGRVFLFLSLPVALYFNRRHELWKRFEWWQLLAAIFFFMAILTPMILTHVGLTAPRYLLPAILAFDLLVGYVILFQLPAHERLRLRLSRRKRVLYLVALLGLVSGNFWVYPHRVAQGWDATPAHLPYYRQLEDAVTYLDDHNVPLEAVTSVFPSAGARDFQLLNDEDRGFTNRNQLPPDTALSDLTDQHYFFVSIIHNDWTDEELDFIERQAVIWQQSSWNGVWAKLYRRGD